MADTRKRVLNFAAGPAKLPEEVSEKRNFTLHFDCIFLVCVLAV